MDIRSPRDGRVIEELGTYDPMISETDARVNLKRERVDYWLSVGAQPSEKVSVLIKKYGSNGTHLSHRDDALERLASQRRRPEIIDAPPAPKREEKKEEEPSSPKPEAATKEAEKPESSPPEATAPKAEEKPTEADNSAQSDSENEPSPDNKEQTE
jgi:small subunit ribosomal protein S16